MKTVLVLDTETTGLDRSQHAVIEVAVALWSVEHLSMVSCQSWLVDASKANDAFHINGIPDAVTIQGDTWENVQHEVLMLQYGADATLAHNAPFDRQWFDAEIQAQPWICTRSDITWPKTGGKTSLVDTALAHGVGVVHAHRAISDVLTLVHLLERAAELTDVAEMLRRGLRPKARYKALVSYERRDEARAAGFNWDPTAKGWFRQMAVEDAGKLGFPVQSVQP